MKPDLTSSGSLRKRSVNGFVLPVSLILLVIVTGIIAAQMQRAFSDERMASNSRERIVADNAAQTVLRWCELRLNNSPETVANITAPGKADPAAWRDSSNWVPAKTFTVAGVALPGVSSHSCLIEQADGELAGSISDSGEAGDPTGKARWMKFRITARVERISGGFDHVQSELRLFRQ